jgi:hypothetical protein
MSRYGDLLSTGNTISACVPEMKKPAGARPTARHLALWAQKQAEGRSPREQRAYPVKRARDYHRFIYRGRRRSAKYRAGLRHEIVTPYPRQREIRMCHVPAFRVE